MAEVCKLAWHTFYGMQKACEDFENLRFEVWTIAISLDSLHSVGTTSLLIDRQPDKARWALTFSKILTSLGAVLRPLHNLVRQYLGSSSKERASIKNWLVHSDVTFEGVTIQDFRRKLSMLVETLNVFLSCLTHAELARARETSESEEFRVLREVSKQVLHKWDSDLPIGTRRSTDRSTQRTEFNGLGNEEVRMAGSPVLQNPSSGLGLQLPNVPPSPVHPRHLQGPSSRLPPPNAMNLENIENGFITHMHAMRRIREQLRHQQINNEHPGGQTSPHFLGVNDNSRGQGWGAHPPLTPTTPTLRHNMTDSSSSSELSGDYLETSSSGSSDHSHQSGSIQSSDASSVHSHHLNTVEEDIKPITVPDHQQSYGHIRKRKRRPEYRFKTGLEAEHSHSSDGDGSDEALDYRRHPKTALERMLSGVLFFDQ